MRHVLAIIFLCCSLLSCSDELFENYWVRYTIPEGEHTSITEISPVDNLAFQVYIEEAYDTIALGNDKYDWNKLYGFTTMHIHDNSHRIGFRLLNGRWEYAAYAYVDGDRNYKIIGTGDVGEIAEFKITRLAGTVEYCMGGFDCITLPANTSDKWYRSWPYFGGNRTAPNEIKIRIKEH